MVAPAITLSIMFTSQFILWFGGRFIRNIYGFFKGDKQQSGSTFAFSYYHHVKYTGFRFKVPLVLAIVAILSFAVAILIAAHTNEAPDSIRDLFLLSANGPFALITLIIGVIVFIIAMLFDMSDPHRVTRSRSKWFLVTCCCCTCTC